MTKRQPIGEIICGSQAKLLALMQDTPGRLGMQELMGGAGISRTFASRLLMELRELDLADVATAGELPEPRADKRGRTAKLYTITRAGSRALVRYQRKADDAEKVVVEPARSNMFARPDYVPSSTAFYRNAGNKHIQSRGYPC